MANGENGLQAPQFEELSQLDKDIQKRKAKRQATRRGRQGERPGGLTITSLMDALTILLVFLLVSITSDPLNIKQDDNMLLAHSTIRFTPDTETVPIVVSKRSVVVDGEDIVPLKCRFNGKPCKERADGDAKSDFQWMNECSKAPAPTICNNWAGWRKVEFKFDDSLRQDKDPDSFVIVKLLKKLDEVVEAQKKAEEKAPKSDDDEKEKGNKRAATVVVDSSIPFRVIVDVMKTAGMAELNTVRFAVMYSGLR